MGIRQWPPRPGRPRLKSSPTAIDSFNFIRRATGLVQMAVAILQHVHLRLAMRENSPLRTAPCGRLNSSLIVPSSLPSTAVRQIEHTETNATLHRTKRIGWQFNLQSSLFNGI